MTRFCAVTAPALLLAYGILRWIDGLDGHHKGEPFWSAGHVAFFIAIVLFGMLAVALDRTIRSESPARRHLADAATAAAVFGAACFLWVILGDLSADFRDAAPLPDPLQTAGPALFQIGLLTLLILLVVNRPRRLPVWSPVLVLLGFAMIAINLDLLPVAAVVVGLGLYPLAIQTSRRSVTATA
jgi:cytochrome bd-type quinol oxidase subunit 2